MTKKKMTREEAFNLLFDYVFDKMSKVDNDCVVKKDFSSDDFTLTICNPLSCILSGSVLHCLSFVIDEIQNISGYTLFHYVCSMSNVCYYVIYMHKK